MAYKCLHILTITLLGLLLEKTSLADMTKEDPKLSHILGRGYDSNLKIMREACISGRMNATKTKKLSLDSIFDQSFQSVFQEKRGFFGAGLNLGFIGGKGRTDFIFRNLSSKQRTSLINRIYYEHARIEFDDYKTNIFAQNALTIGPAEVQGLCGDQLINSVKVGSALYVSASLMFPTEKSFKEFRTKITISFLFGLIKIRKEFTETFEKVAKDATIHFDVLQLGADAKAFNDLKTKNPGYCSIDNLDTCLNYYDELLTYVNDGFAKSIHKSSMQQMHPLSFNTIDYRFSKVASLHTGTENFRSGDAIRVYDNTAEPLIELYSERDLLEKRIALDGLTKAEKVRLTVKKQKLEDEIDKQIELMELQLKEGQMPAF